MPIISNDTKLLLLSISNSAPDEFTGAFDQIISHINKQKGKWSQTAKFSKAGESIVKIINAKFYNLTSANSDMIKRALIARLAVESLDLIKMMNLPKDILEMYSPAFDRLAKFLTNKNEKYSLKDDYFYKDIRFVLGMTVPCGAQVVDLISKVPVSSVILSIIRSGKIKSLSQYINVHGNGVWFRIHTESRYLDEFSEAGWDQCYKRIAELLLWNENVSGMVGTSWFYDPQLIKISPRLGYLQSNPLERGAFLIRHGSGQNHIDYATKTSNTRKQLYEEGKYLPICHSLLWPRKKLINWHHGK